jgi:hypothetical protein
VSVDVRVANARIASGATDALARSIVVVGALDSAEDWRRALGQASAAADSVRVLNEQGQKGNFLGALQAYRRINDEPEILGPLQSIDQIVMFVGTGSRLSPITQSLRNMKAALLLPSGAESSGTLTVGEAAVRSSAPWIRALRDGGFDGIVIRWGDEIMIPSADFGALGGQFSDVDAVRFGYYARPNELLASQKEWLLADELNNVYAELPRQHLDRLLDEVSRFRAVKALHVNLGSFAISHRLLGALETAFGELVDSETVAANWDPYLWMALHSTTRKEWENDCRAGRTEVPRDFAQLVEGIPDFWNRAQAAKSSLEAQTGRPFAARVLDFGDPYWFDAGNHAALRAGLRDVFSTGLDGQTLRAFLELPEDLAHGGTFVRESEVPPDVRLRNSVVIGSTLSDPGSYAERSIVIASTLGRLRADPGSVVIECECSELEIDGPEGFAVRLEGAAHVRGDEVTAGIRISEGIVRLSHFGPSVIVGAELFENRVWANPMSFTEASDLVTEFAAHNA